MISRKLVTDIISADSESPNGALLVHLWKSVLTSEADKIHVAIVACLEGTVDMDHVWKLIDMLISVGHPQAHTAKICMHVELGHTTWPQVEQALASHQAGDSPDVAYAHLGIKDSESE